VKKGERKIKEVRKREKIFAGGMKSIGKVNKPVTRCMKVFQEFRQRPKVVM
jgi:hypothetical protein